MMATPRPRDPGELREVRSGLEGMVLRPAELGDLETVCAIEARSFSNPWHPDTFRSLLRRDPVRIFVADLPGQGVVGYAVVWWVVDEGELANLAVAEAHQRRGIGSALLDHVLDQVRGEGVRSLFLEVRSSNSQARRLYIDRGFRQVAIRRGYYRNPREDALVLVRHVRR